MKRKTLYAAGVALLAVPINLMSTYGTAPSVTASAPDCYYSGSLVPVETLLLCTDQCEYRFNCKYLDESLTYTYTECSDTGGGTQEQCQNKEVTVEERTACMKDSTKECDHVPWYQGCINGECAPNDDEFQCKLNPNRSTFIVKEELLLPYEYFESCD